VLRSFCGARLPKELLFSDEERKEVDAELGKLRQRWRESQRVENDRFGTTGGGPDIYD
jgi:hypothetical protein